MLAAARAGMSPAFAGQIMNSPEYRRIEKEFFDKVEEITGQKAEPTANDIAMLQIMARIEQKLNIQSSARRMQVKHVYDGCVTLPGNPFRSWKE